jgi:hypothetical protein
MPQHEEDDPETGVAPSARRRPVDRVPVGSVFYEKVVPVILILLASTAILVAVISLMVILDVLPHG